MKYLYDQELQMTKYAMHFWHLLYCPWLAELCWLDVDCLEERAKGYIINTP